MLSVIPMVTSNEIVTEHTKKMRGKLKLLLKNERKGEGNARHEKIATKAISHIKANNKVTEVSSSLSVISVNVNYSIKGRYWQKILKLMSQLYAVYQRLILDPNTQTD